MLRGRCKGKLKSGDVLRADSWARQRRRTFSHPDNQPFQCSTWRRGPARRAVALPAAKVRPTCTHTYTILPGPEGLPGYLVRVCKWLALLARVGCGPPLHGLGPPARPPAGAAADAGSGGSPSCVARVTWLARPGLVPKIFKKQSRRSQPHVGVAPSRLRSARRCRTGEPKLLQPTSYLEYGTRSLRGRPQQPPPKAPKAW